jgi:predicted transposase YdaD
MSLDEVLESTGLTAKWEVRGEARGEQKKALEIARNLLKRGWNVEETAETAALDIEKVRALYESLHT